MEGVVTGLAILGGLFLLAAPVFAFGPHVLAQVSAWIRRDPDGAWVAHRRALAGRMVAAALLVFGVTLLVAVQPHPFRLPSFRPTDDGDPLRAVVESQAGPLIESGRCVGLVVGVVDADGPRLFGFGRSNLWRRQPPDGATVFEVGSATQVFTGLLYQRLTEAGVVQPERPLRELLPDSVSVPTFGDEPIVLDHLATHRSGLPEAPAGFGASLADVLPPFADPWRHLKTVDLYQYLSSSVLDRAPGSRVERSDLGMGLLGRALEHGAHASYDSLVLHEIGAPLGLQDTRVTPTGDMRRRAAQGYVVGWGAYRGWRLASPAHAWHVASVPGAAGLHATADDLLALLSAELGLVSSPMESLMADTRRPRFPLDAGTSIGVGWLVSRAPEPGGPFAWQHGATGGFRSWIGLSESRRVGVVVLANTATALDSLGWAVLRAAAALQPEEEWPQETEGPDEEGAPRGDTSAADTTGTP